MKLNEIMDQGRKYLAHVNYAATGNLTPMGRIELGQKALRLHSDAMKGVDIYEAEIIIAAMVGAIKAAERKAPCGGHLGDALAALEDVMVSLRLNCQEEEAAEPETPAQFHERLSGEQLGLRSV